jgi:hypothetical protein
MAAQIKTKYCNFVKIQREKGKRERAYEERQLKWLLLGGGITGAFYFNHVFLYKDHFYQLSLIL